MLSVGIVVPYAWILGNPASLRAKSLLKSYLAIVLCFILTVGLLGAGIALYSSRPALNASEVRSIINLRAAGWKTDIRVTHVEYYQPATWKVKVVGAKGFSYWLFDERTFEITVLD
ncbi:MAG: hypothetical protein A2147_07460 [Chloroflexi bacterium RBG_16_57_8]|nr:MAG: hypothetical protein A2147_07460 [Chloroflexi bacterium RBG_16_57_8]